MRGMIDRDDIEVNHMDTMKAVRIHQYGGPEVLVYEDAPRPALMPDDVLVRVHAAGVNPVDWKIRQGYRKEALKHKLPLILGWDVSGVIEQIGPEVTQFKVGDEVYSRPDIARDGGYAEYIAIRQSEIALKPKSVDHIHAAAIPLAALTAWQSLFDAAGLEAEQKVLIHGAAGGVGHLAVQLAKWKGAHVLGTASIKNHSFLYELGAEAVIDYENVAFDEVLRDVDVVFDTIGGETMERSWKVLRPGGILISIISPPSQEEAEAKDLRAGYVFVQPNQKQLAQIAELVDSDVLNVFVETVMPLNEARHAHELSEARHTRGKIVLSVQ